MFSFFRHPKPVGDGKAIATQVMNQAGGTVFDSTTFIVPARPPAVPTVLPAAPTPRDEKTDEAGEA